MENIMKDTDNTSNGCELVPLNEVSVGTSGEDVNLEVAPENRKDGRRQEKTKCPIQACQKLVKELPRHMRLVHGWSQVQARHVKAKYCLRKPHPVRKLEKKKDTHYHRHCPVGTCGAIVKKLPQHLQQVHKIKTTDPNYRALLRNAQKSRRYNKCVPQRTAKSVPAVLSPTETLVTGPLFSESDSSEISECQLFSTEVDSTSGEEEEMKLEEEITHGSEEDISSSVMDKAKKAQEYEAEEVDTSESDLAGDSEAECGISETDSHEQEASYLLKLFFNFLTSADCGRRDESSSRQCVNQVRCILEVVDEEEDVHSLLDKNLIRDVFLKGYAEKQKKLDPRTVKAYLKSLDHFLNFLQAEQFLKYNRDDIMSMRANVSRWSSAYTGQVKEASFHKMELQRMSRIFPEDIVQFEDSAIVKNTMDTIRRLEEGEVFVVTQEMFTTCRDLVAIQIFFDNGHRPAPLRNMTMKNYNEARFNAHDGQYTITVMKHKGAKEHGPAEIVLGEKLFKLLKVYVKHLRPAVTTDVSEQSHVFVTWFGTPFQKGGSVSNALNSIWNKAGLPSRICATKIRKAAVSVARENVSPGSTFHDELATLMCHKKSTADRYYYLEDKARKARNAAKVLPSLMRRGTSTRTSEMKVDQRRSPSTISCSPFRAGYRRKAWTAEELQEIKELFNNEIQCGSIGIEDVREKMKKSEVLQNLSPKKVYDKVRAIYRYGQLSPRDWQEDSSANSETPHTTEPSVGDVVQEAKLETGKPSGVIRCSSQRIKDIFSPEDILIIKSYCRDMIRGAQISQVKILAALNITEEGKQVLDKYSMKQLQNRVKYERKMYRDAHGY